LRALSQFLVTETSLGDTLYRVAEIATAALPSARMAGMSMLGEDGTPITAVFTDPDSPAIDQAQYEARRGPCLDAWRAQEIVVVDDVDKVADDYAEFSAACRDHGVFSTLSLPLAAAGVGIGAFNLYAPERHGFSAHDTEIGLDLAAAAATVLANASAYWSAYEHSVNLAEAMKSRATIEQAKGILMANSPHLSADDAFQILSQASQRENRKVREIARQIVDRATPRPPRTP
jgi:putative methionine-R-sulfoxide reductase with GAF domain